MSALARAITEPAEPLETPSRVAPLGQPKPRLRLADPLPPDSDRVPPPAPVTAPRAPFVLLILVLVAAGFVGLLAVNTKINENSFTIHDLRVKQRQLDAREQQLSGEIANRESTGSLAAAARRLGLVPAGTPAFIRLPDGRVLGVPRPATGTPEDGN